MIATIPDPEAPVQATPGWSVTDVIGHMAVAPSRQLDLINGTGDYPDEVTDLPAFNEQQVRNLPTRDLPELGHLLRTSVAPLVSEVVEAEEAGEQPMMDFDGGQRLPADRMLGSMLGELLIHGRDVTATFTRPWDIDPDLVPLVMEGLCTAMPGWVNTAKAARLNFRIRYRLRELTEYVYEFRDGALIVDPEEPGRPHATITVDPVTGLLLTYGQPRLSAPLSPARLSSGAAARGWRDASKLFSTLHEPDEGFECRRTANHLHRVLTK